MSYVTTETDGHVSICVDVLNPAGEGALKSFTVGLLPEPGMPMSFNFESYNLSIKALIASCNHSCKCILTT